MKPSESDRVLLLGPWKGNRRQGVALHRDGRVSSGVMTRADEGRPLQPGMELVEVTERVHEDGTSCAMSPAIGRSLYTTPVDHTGPARVATPAYREGWDRTFGGGHVN